MTHLTSDELVDALDGVLDPGRQRHLDACPPCRQQCAELGAVLCESRAVGMPEPSPLYWQHLSHRVRTAIDAEPPAADGWGRWLHWPVLVPIAALVLILAALTVTVPQSPRVTTDVADGDGAEVERADSFAVVAALMGEMDWETAVSAGLTVAPGAADRAVLELTAAEQQELTRLLEAELTRAKS